MRRLYLIAIVMLACVGSAFWFYPRAKPYKTVEYKTYTGANPFDVEMTFVAPTDDLESVPITPIDGKFRAGDLLSIHGSLVMPDNESPGPILVSFVRHQRDGRDVIGNSAAITPTGDPRRFRMPVNAPRSAGEYDLQIKSLTGYIARAKIIVNEKPAAK